MYMFIYIEVAASKASVEILVHVYLCISSGTLSHQQGNTTCGYKLLHAIVEPLSYGHHGTSLSVCNGRCYLYRGYIW